MPIYEYKCGSCERTFEALQRMSDSDLVAGVGCAVSDKCTLQKLISACRIRARGIEKEYDPPTAQNIMGPNVTRTWMEPDGSMREMKRDEWLPDYVGTNANAGS